MRPAGRAVATPVLEKILGKTTVLNHGKQKVDTNADKAIARDETCHSYQKIV